MRKKKLPPAGTPVSNERHYEVDVVIRLPAVYGKREKLRSELAHTLDRECGLRFPGHEILEMTFTEKFEMKFKEKS